MISQTVPANSAEELIYQICRQSFLSLWSYRNPKQGPGGKELCDVLVVCEPDVIIFSVKDIKLKGGPKPFVGERRWQRKAIEESCNQIYGAERIIASSPSVTRHDDLPGLAFPASANIHRIAIAFGGRGKTGLPFGDFGRGFVHVFDERSTMTLLSELDTITDFVNYLRAKEQFFRSPTVAIPEGTEEDLLALYLHQGRNFPAQYDCVVVGPNLWGEFQSKPEYQRKSAADVASYVWDRLIDTFCEDALNNNLEFGPDLKGTERAIRMMAREDRFSRRILGKSFREFIDESQTVRSRMVRSPSGVVYVFLAMPHDTRRDYRVAELGTRCFVARGLNQDATTVVGIATEKYEKGKGFSLDLVHLYIPRWTAKNQSDMVAMQRDLGLFVSPVTTPGHEDEYPSD